MSAVNDFNNDTKRLIFHYYNLNALWPLRAAPVEAEAVCQSYLAADGESVSQLVHQQ